MNFPGWFDTTAATRAVAFVALCCISLVAATGVSASPVVQEQGEATLYMPLIWKNIETSQINRPIGRTPTPTSTSSPTLEPSPTVQATFTPEPTATATAMLETGTIHGRYVVHGEPLTAGFGSPGTPQIELRLLQGGDFEGLKIASAIVEEDGSFSFVDPPALAPNQAYQVWWTNDSLTGHQAWLGRWFSRRIVQFGDGSDVDLGTMEISDVKLTGPGNDIHFSLPTTYTWTPRRERRDEIYKWSLYRSCDENDRHSNVYRTPSLGHVGRYELGSPPPGGWRIDERYCWYVWIEDGDAGSGWSFYRWKTLWLP